MAIMLIEREAREDWAVANGARVYEGVKINGLIRENWEKPLATIVAEVEKEGPTLVVMGAAEIADDTRDCKVREEGVNVTC